LGTGLHVPNAARVSFLTTCLTAFPTAICVLGIVDFAWKKQNVVALLKVATSPSAIRRFTSRNHSVVLAHDAASVAHQNPTEPGIDALSKRKTAWEEHSVR
jgi:hypothetical protein